MLKLLVAVCTAALAYSANAKALEPVLDFSDQISTQEALHPELSQDGAYKLARSHFLPDYQAALTGRTSASNGGGSSTKTCATYGAVEINGCPKDTVGEGKYTPAPGVTCYKNCKAKTCSEVSSSYQSSIPEDYKCTPVSTAAGVTCYKDCEPKTCSEIDSAYVESCGSHYKGVLVLSKAGITCYKSCTPMSCTEVNRSYKTSVPDGYKCTRVVTNANVPCYKDCTPKSCSEVNSSYKSSVPEDYKCTPFSTVAGVTCYRDCTAKSCTEVNSSYKSSIPAGYKCSSILTKANVVCYKNCTAKSCTEVNSSYKDSQPSGETCTKFTTAAGKVCYKDCKANSCESYGEMPAVPGGYICAKAVHGDLTCYKDCTQSYCGTGYANGDKVYDATNGKLIALKEGTKYYNIWNFESLGGANCATRIPQCTDKGGIVPSLNMLPSLEELATNQGKEVKDSFDSNNTPGYGFCTSTQCGSKKHFITNRKSTYNGKEYSYERSSDITATACRDETGGDNNGKSSTTPSGVYVEMAVARLCMRDCSKLMCPYNYTTSPCGSRTELARVTIDGGTVCYKCSSSSSSSSGSSSGCTASDTGHAKCKALGLCSFKWCYIPKACYNTGGTMGFINDCTMLVSKPGGGTTYQSRYNYANCIAATDASGKTDPYGEYHCCSECNSAQ